jgi:hypothetical protein
MPMRSPRKYDLIKFIAADVFPPTSELAMDILRLMAAYNDISEVLDWMIGTRSIATRRIAEKKARIRMSIQNRILLGLMHETFRVIDQMQGTGEFKEVKALLPERGMKSLKNLQLASSGEVAIRSRLKLARDRVAFHYDRESFIEGASIFSRLFVERARAESLIIFERGSRAYYYYPEQVREIVAFGFNEGDSGEQIPVKLGQYLTEVKKLMHEVGDFLDELLPAYAEMKSLGSALKHETVME